MKKVHVACLVALGVCLVAAETYAGPSFRIMLGPIFGRPIILAPVPPIIVAPMPREDYGFIELNVRPADADIFIDDEYKGSASKYVGKRFQTRVGAHRMVICREGFRSEQVTLRVDPGRTVELVAELERIAPPACRAAVVVDSPVPNAPPPPEVGHVPPTPAAAPTPYQVDMNGTGYLALNVVPKDASVYVDDQFYGTASQFNDTDQAIVLRAGPHKVEIARPGFESYAGTLDVSVDKQTNVEVTLKKHEARSEK